ncbi:unnamed protein product [Pleuronectes platessa]|uniref:Uncharacterized protein n=1 Tax=Pleuronectes platessa TaxID=8262 RepID=A0A9N7Z9P0_PLEPL|nr:unnamed protein product [Pleuronectes platessa]
MQTPQGPSARPFIVKEFDDLRLRLILTLRHLERAAASHMFQPLHRALSFHLLLREVFKELGLVGALHAPETLGIWSGLVVYQLLPSVTVSTEGSQAARLVPVLLTGNKTPTLPPRSRASLLSARSHPHLSLILSRFHRFCFPLLVHHALILLSSFPSPLLMETAAVGPPSDVRADEGLRARKGKLYSTQVSRKMNTVSRLSHIKLLVSMERETERPPTQAAAEATLMCS